MTTWPDVPQFGVLLAPHLSGRAAPTVPAYLAGLERSAAARYRAWAEAVPEYAATLTECARREDEIADLISAAFPVSSDDAAEIAAALVPAVELYYSVFAPYSVREQLYIQAQAELQGANAWRNMAVTVDDPAVREVLARCEALEQESSVAVMELLG